jgi:energy coupling factor transporter S component ThiW
MSTVSPVAATHSALSVRKLVLTGMLACFSFVLSTFVYFPSMAPFQHFCNVLGAVFLGPWYGFAAAAITGLMRMIIGGRTIQALVGGIFGAFLSGLLYQKTRKLWCAVAGEVFGTGILSALAAYPLMRMFYGLDAQSFLYYIPFYTPSSAMGAFLAVIVLGILKRSGILAQMLGTVNR